MNHVYVTRHAWLDSAQQSHSQSNRQFAAASAQTTEARCDDEGQSVDDRQSLDRRQARPHRTQPAQPESRAASRSSSTQASSGSLHESTQRKLMYIMTDDAPPSFPPPFPSQLATSTIEHSQRLELDSRPSSEYTTPCADTTGHAQRKEARRDRARQNATLVWGDRSLLTRAKGVPPGTATPPEASLHDTRRPRDRASASAAMACAERHDGACGASMSHETRRRGRCRGRHLVCTSTRHMSASSPRSCGAQGQQLPRARSVAAY